MIEFKQILQVLPNNWLLVQIALTLILIDLAFPSTSTFVGSPKAKKALEAPQQASTRYWF